MTEKEIIEYQLKQLKKLEGNYYLTPLGTSNLPFFILKLLQSKTTPIESDGKDE